MSPTRRTKKTEQAKSSEAARSQLVVPEVISAPSVISVPSVPGAARGTGRDAQKSGKAPAQGDVADTDNQATAPIPRAPGSSIVEQAQLASEGTQPLPVVKAGAAVAAAVAAHEASVQREAEGEPARPSVKAKVEKQRTQQRAAQERSAQSRGAVEEGAAGSAAVATTTTAATTQSQQPSASAPYMPAQQPVANKSAGQTDFDASTCTYGDRAQSARTRNEGAPEEGAQSDAAAAASATERPRIKNPFRRPDGKRPVWLKVAAAVLVVLVLLAAAVACTFAWTEWGRSNDAYDIQGSWTMEGGSTPIDITAEKIILSKDAAYSYALDTRDKTITFSFANRLGGGRYRFSLDRTQLAVMEGGSTKWSDLVWDDFKWCIQAYVAWWFRGETLSPAYTWETAGQAEDSYGEDVAITLLTKVEGTSAETVSEPESGTSTIVIERSEGTQAADSASTSTSTSDAGDSAATASPSASPSDSSSPAASASPSSAAGEQ